jgi:replicative superfamily II helicase
VFHGRIYKQAVMYNVYFCKEFVMEGFFTKIIDKNSFLRNTFVASSIRKTKKEIADIEKQIDDTTLSFNFLDEDDAELRQMNMEVYVAETVISHLKTELKMMLKTHLTETELLNFSSKSQQLHDLVKQQDMLRHKRELFLQQYEADRAIYNKAFIALVNQAEKLKRKLYDLEKQYQAVASPLDVQTV